MKISYTTNINTTGRNSGFATQPNSSGDYLTAGETYSAKSAQWINKGEWIQEPEIEYINGTGLVCIQSLLKYLRQKMRDALPGEQILIKALLTMIERMPESEIVNISRRSKDIVDGYRILANEHTFPS